MSDYPISFVMNRIFKSYVYNDTVAWEALPADADMPEALIGLSCFFNCRSVEFERKVDIDTTKYLDTRDDAVIKRLKKTLPTISSKSALEKLVEETQKQRKKHMKESRENSPFRGEACVINSSEDTIIIPLPFETMVNLIAFAQSGHIVRLQYAPDQAVPLVKVEKPALKNIIGTAGGKSIRKVTL